MRAWDEFLALQERDLGKETVTKWLKPLKVIRFDACNLYLEAGDSFKAVWFDEHIRHRAKSHLLNNNNKPIKIHLSVANLKKEPPVKKRVDSPPPEIFRLTFDEVNPEATFDNFAQSQNNLLAYKLLKESCEKDRLSLNFNPIYLFGRPGTGKTHLIMATANELRSHGLNIVYVRADTFTEHVVSAIRSGEMQTFRKSYRNIDGLLIDDIEIFGKKGATQEELFHTFNTLHTDGKQIILSANSPPQELKHIAERLVSRFEWGIVIPLQMLEKEEMRQVLLEKAKKVHFPLPENVCDFLLNTFGNNTKNLVRALEALMLRTHLNLGVGNSTERSLNPASAEKILADLIQEEEKALLTPAKIIRTVAEFYGIRIEDILSKSHTRECALPRQIAMHLCRRQLNLPYTKIGDIFARDHSTVMSSVKQVQKDVDEKNLEISGAVNRILKRLELS